MLSLDFSDNVKSVGAFHFKEILMNTKEKSGNKIFPFFAHKTILCDIKNGWLHS